MGPEIRTNQGWRPLRQGPKLPAGWDVEMRGFSIGIEVRLGSLRLYADESGRISCGSGPNEPLHEHVGFLPVRVGGDIVGEIEIEPGKLTMTAFAALVSDLQRVWVDLVLYPEGPTTLRAVGPDPREIWVSVRSAIRAMAARPPQQIGIIEGWVGAQDVRLASEYTPAVHLAVHQGRRARARRRGAVSDDRLMGFVVNLLERLQVAARRGQEIEVAEEIQRTLTRPPFDEWHGRPAVGSPPLILRRDPRYRPLLRAAHALDTEENLVTEGPGDLRLGIRRLDRIYEYWVFLKVLETARSRYGPPVDEGFSSLAHRRPGRRLHLDLKAGTEVVFPGDVVVAFEPVIHTDPRQSWQGLEYQPHPLKSRTHLTPDVVIYAKGGRAIVIDAKFRGRHMVDEAAVDVHAHYGRIRSGGRGIVDRVVVAHPSDLVLDYAGYGATPFVPGGEEPAVDLPEPVSV